VTSQVCLEQLTKVKLYGTLATTVPLYNISTLCNRNEILKNIYHFSESLKGMQRIEERHAAREPQFGHPWCITNGCVNFKQVKDMHLGEQLLS